MVRIKICGIKTIDIAEYVVNLGADALGFILFEKSVRFVNPEEVKNITLALPGFINKVGVFVDKNEDEILDIVNYSGLDTIQLHGDYDRSFISSLRKKTSLPIILVVRVDELNEEVLSNIDIPEVNNIHIDKLDVEQWGGTGQRVGVASELSKNIRDFINKRVIIAGGVDAGNVKEIISTLNPYGIDLSSSLEREKGVKDKGLIKEFFEQLK